MRIRSTLAVLFLLAASTIPGAMPATAQVAVSPHGELPEDLDCSACHTAEGWTPLRSPLAFTHGARGGFLITGAHEQANCSACHLDLRFSGPDVAMRECAGCHVDVHQGAMVEECSACHTTRSFQDVDGEAVHARTAFPLTGAHRQVSCASCHVDDQGGAFSALDTECASCHLDAYQGARTVDHVGGGYPTDCTQCHSTLAWEDTPAFDHAAVSGGFDLLGAHGDLRCASCHSMPGFGLLFTAAGPEDCVGCHQDDFDRRHGASSGFSTQCAGCHTVTSWKVENFDHGLTGFALRGTHAGLACGSCHVDGGGLRFPPPAQQEDCVACHQADYQDEHAGSGFPTTCASCHNEGDWEEASFDHGTTVFPLVGAHRSTSCADCHGPPAHLVQVFAGPEECLACHQADYDREHAGSGFPTTCLLCHNQADWDAASLDHAALANGYALDGPHATAACETCHMLPDYGLKFPVPAAQEDCVACHQAEYDQEHAGSGFPTTCLSCHQPDRWDGASFDHVQATGYALEGPHAQAACETCHTLPDYGLKFPVPTAQEDCVACHQAEYDQEHAGSGFPTTCLSCHQPDLWDGASFDHVQVTGFGLEGPHAPLECTACHAVPGYVLLFPQPASPDDCVACHQGDYDREHAGSGFPTTCLTCHQAGTWSGATLDHPSISGGFDLLGAHATIDCAACHTVPGYALRFPSPSGAQDCFVCHQDEYASEHASQGYPTDCMACHTVNAWDPSTFDHDRQYFPIYSGEHRGEWKTCADCHTTPSDFGAFSCLTCHEHNKPEMDSEHRGKTGYVYESRACLSCHPTGKAD